MSPKAGAILFCPVVPAVVVAMPMLVAMAMPMARVRFFALTVMVVAMMFRSPFLGLNVVTMAVACSIMRFFSGVPVVVRGFHGRGRRVGGAFVCVAIHLKNEESDAGEHQSDIRPLSKALEGFGGAPDSEKNEHDREGGDLPELDTHVKGENARDQPFIAEG